MAYKVRQFESGSSKQGNKFVNYSITIPRSVAENLPDNALFECELTEDGILFRPTEARAEKPLPSWTKSQNGTKAKPKASKPRGRKPSSKKETQEAS